MSKDIKLFNKEELPFSHKFYRLMDLLISKQAESRDEAFLLTSIFYLQIISTFFSKHAGVFNSSKGIRPLKSISKS